MITTSAPGKVVLWGEYAVLDGAPAMVMAVNRRATCTVTPHQTVWRFQAEGYRADPVALTLEQLQSKTPRAGAAAIASCVVATDEQPAGDPVSATISTRALHDGDAKLGLGSSAAATVAVQAALAASAGRQPDQAHALRAHRLLQGDGSGMDVSASFLGGTVRFQAGTGTRTETELPPHQFIWTGKASATVDHLARFAEYRRSADTAALSALCDASACVFRSTDLETLASYAGCLQHLDEVAGLGIYAGGHEQLVNIASNMHLVYKPCGAGGGDVGVAFATDTDALDAFARHAQLAGFSILQLETATHGVEVSA